MTASRLEYQPHTSSGTVPEGFNITQVRDPGLEPKGLLRCNGEKLSQGLPDFFE